MVQKTNSKIRINKDNPKILNDYLKAVRDDDKVRLDSASSIKLVKQLKSSTKMIPFCWKAK